MTTILPRTKGKRRQGDLSDLLFYQIKVCGLPLPCRELVFHPTRKWRFDLAWILSNAPPLAVECHGGIYIHGGHTRGAHFESDCEKMNEAVVLGWRVLAVTRKQIESGQAITWIEKLLKA